MHLFYISCFLFTASITAIFFSEGREEYLHLSALKTYFHFKSVCNSVRVNVCMDGVSLHCFCFYIEGNQPVVLMWRSISGLFGYENDVDVEPNSEIFGGTESQDKMKRSLFGFFSLCFPKV